MSAAFELILAGPEHVTVLANLLELYIHDFSEIVPVDVGEDGQFGYSYLPLYWSDSRRKSFLAKLDGKWAGFALVKRDYDLSAESEVWDMAEFFVLRRYRRRGVGFELAEGVWRSCPGKWQIRVMADNASALKFWQASIERFTGARSQSRTIWKDGVDWQLFSFESKT